MNEWIDISIPNLFGNEKKYLLDCIDSNFVSSVGPYVKRFEESIAEYIDLPKNCVTATNSGTSALHLALISSGVTKEDIVIIPNYTFIATANAVRNANATPWIMDISSESLTINPELIVEELERNTFVSNGYRYHKNLKKRVFALIPVHVFGYAPDLDSLTEISKTYNLKIISDAAGGLGSFYKQKKLGKSVESGIISFNGNKIITTGGGGIFFSENTNLVAKVKHLASTAKTSADVYLHDQVGFNFRISNLHAALGLAQVERLDSILRKRLTTARKYEESFRNSSYFKFLTPPSYTSSSNWLNAIIINHDLDLNINTFINYLNQNNLKIRPYWLPMHMQTAYKNCPRSAQSISSSIYARVIVLPSSTGLTEDEMEYSIEKINAFFKI